MTLLRCPKFLRCLTADAPNFDRGHSLTSLPLPLAALSSLPTSSRLHALHVTLPQGRPSQSPAPPRSLQRFRRGDPCGRPPIALLAKTVSLRTSDRFTGVAIRTPVLMAPLPKGGWHGKAVTGGFLPVLKPPARLRQNRIFSPSSTRLRMSARSSLVSPLGSLAVTAMLRPPFSATRPMPLARLPATCLRVRPAA